jgi:regulatory protein
MHETPLADQDPDPDLAGPRREPFVAPDPLDQDAAQRMALRIIQGASQSEQALRRKLLRRGYDLEVVERVLAGLIQSGVVDDRAQAASLARRRLGRGYAARVVRRELRSKGLDAALVEEVTGAITEADELEGARRVLEAMPRRHGEPVFHHRSRVRAALQRRGFSLGVIRAAERALEAEASGEPPA